MNNELLSLLGIARRAKKLTLGNDATVEAIRGGHTRLILVASDLSKRSLKAVALAAEDEMVDVILLNETMDDISVAVNKRSGIIAVNDAGFAKKIRTLCPQGIMGKTFDS